MSAVYKIALNDLTIAVTGGYGYLGRAIVESLVAHGAHVFVLARNEDRFNDQFGHTNIEFIHCDVAEGESIANALKEIVRRRGRIDAIINNAYYSKGQSPVEMTDDEWVTGIDGTLNSVFRCIRAVIPLFRAAGGGKIINVSSMYGMVAPDFSVYDESPGFLNPPHYGAAKAGVLQLTRYYASYLGKDNITVNTVTPGPFPSENVSKDKAFISRLSEKTCLGRVGKPEDLAGIFVFLASDAANFITGQNFVVDGGWTAK